MSTIEKNILGQSIEIIGCPFFLLAEGAIYWPDQKALIIADLHLGKVTHFRKAGIAVPLEAKNSNWRKLNDLIVACNPSKILFLGDLFHSSYNMEWDELQNFMDIFKEKAFHLIMGNHDILDEELYANSVLILSEKFCVGEFILTHHPLENIPEGNFNFCGHIHPAVRLVGKAHQSIKLSCFYEKSNQMILPAFGAFTGSMNLNIEEADRIYGIVEGEILKIK